MSTRTLALLAALAAALIYGLTFTVAKHVMPVYIKPYGFIVLRVFGATLLFWFSGLFIKKEKIAKADYGRIFLAAVFGVGLNMLTFFKGLSYTTPINASVVMVMVPIIVLSLSAILLKEHLAKYRIIGVFLGLLGAVYLIAYGNGLQLNNTHIQWGNFLVFINAFSYSLYLILVKKLTSKYHPISFAKWLYLLGFFMVLPFGFKEVQQIAWLTMPTDIFYKMLFVVVFATFVTYLFNLLAVRKLKPTTVSVFIYLQPFIATVFALIMKSDTLNIHKIIASGLIFAGVYLVSKKPKVA
ncbi:MAG: DMT family transporter [Flavobacteriaceae bacterium]|nr:DMT family transporter [Flavobacteriaceae bacterium]